jgi:hypothetical protein
MLLGEGTMAGNTSAWQVPIVIASLIAGCATRGDSRPAHPVEGVRKVVDSLSVEIKSRMASNSFRDLPVVVRTTAAATSGTEPIIAELLRTRLVESGVRVEAACVARCLEISLQEFTFEAKVSALSPGQVLTVAGGSIPLVGGLVRSIGEHEREHERAAASATGVFVTFGARDGNRYTARAHVVAILSAGDVALEPQ